MNKKQLKNFLWIALIFLCVWGCHGLIGGDGFFGGIAEQFYAIGFIISFVFKIAFFIGIVWLIIFILSKFIKSNKKSDQDDTTT